MECRLLMSLWTPLLCVAITRGKSSGGLRGRGYPLDSPNATWLPVEDEVDESLADTKDEIETAEKELKYIKQYCNGKNHGRCKRQVEKMSARLERLIAAEKQLREKDESAKKVEADVKTNAESVIELEDQVNGLHAVKKFAELSKQDFDSQEQRLAEASVEYTKKIEQAQRQINGLKLDLKRARRLHYDAEQESLDLIAKAKGIERGVETTDLYADTEFARAVRKQRVAEGLYTRADAIREHAEKMIILHHDENKSEVKEVMYGVPHRPFITEDQGIVNFGHMSDFGGELPHEDKKKPCKKLKVKKEKKEEDDSDEQEESSNAPADAEDNPNAPLSDIAPDIVDENPNAPADAVEKEKEKKDGTQPAAEVVVDPPQEEVNVNANSDGWKEVEMKDANTHADQWVALPHHKRSTKTITRTNHANSGQMNPVQHGKVTQPKTAAGDTDEQPVEFKKSPEAAQHMAYDDDEDNENEDELQAVEDDEAGGSDEADTLVVEPTTTAVTTTVATVSAPVHADTIDALASEDGAADVDEDSSETAQAEVDEDTVNMDEAERQFKEAEAAEKDLQ